MSDYVSEAPPASREAMQGPWMKDVCRIGQGARCCRYVTCDGGGFDCAKHTQLRRLLDQRVALNTMNARSDNCPGLVKSAEGAEIAA